MISRRRADRLNHRDYVYYIARAHSIAIGIRGGHDLRARTLKSRYWLSCVCARSARARELDASSEQYTYAPTPSSRRRVSVRGGNDLVNVK